MRNFNDVRYYKSAKSGLLYPSVTSVLPEFLFGNDHAKDRGTQVHKACHYINKGVLDWDSLDPEIEPYVRGYELFLKETRFEVDQSELTVVSEKYKTAGTLDLTGKQSKDLWLADLKTGEYSQPLPSWEVQIAAYFRLYQETTGDKRKRKLYAIVLNSKGGYKLFEMIEPDAFTVFLSYLRVFKWESRNAK